jgi:putative ABC transport system permease protein
VREGRQPVLQIPVAGVAESLLGAPAYMDLDALNRALREPNRVSGAYLTIDEAQADRDLHRPAGHAERGGRQPQIQAETPSTLMNTGRGRDPLCHGGHRLRHHLRHRLQRRPHRLAERARDLASLRVIGFTKGEAAFVLLGELAVVTAGRPAGRRAAGLLPLLRHRRGLFHRSLPDPRDLRPVSYGFRRCSWCWLRRSSRAGW